MSTPNQLRGLLGAIWIAAALAVIASVAAVDGLQGAVDTVARDATPDVLAAETIYFSLADLDANAANSLLVGSAEDLGLDQTAIARTFGERRRAAASRLVASAETITLGDQERRPLTELVDGLGPFQADVAKAQQLREQGDLAGALLAYRAATDRMQSELLPRADRLSDVNLALLDDVYERQRASSDRALTLAVAAGLLLLLALVVTSAVLAVRLRRILNPALVLALLLALGLIGGLVATLADAEEEVRRAREDALPQVVDLSRARALAYQANADKSRYLLDEGLADRYEEAFLNRTLRLVRFPGPTELDELDGLFADALVEVQSPTGVAATSFDGYFGAVLRRLSFPGERRLADAAFADFATYQRLDRQVRALNEGGDRAGAVRFALSFEEGASNRAFADFDASLGEVRALNQAAFDDAVAEADGGLRPWRVIPLIAGLLVALLAYLGLRPRIGEYR